jgi:hypothetical protein
VLDLFRLLGAYPLLLICQDNSLQAVWSNSKNDRRLIRYGIALIIIQLAQAACLQLEFYQLLDLYVQYVESACRSLNDPIINCATSACKLDIAYAVWLMIIVSQDVLISVPKVL